MVNNMMFVGVVVVSKIVVTTRFPLASNVKDNGVAVAVPFVFVRRSRLMEDVIEELNLIQREIANAPFFNCVFAGIATVVDVMVECESKIIGMDCFCS
jgi:hypothetical protein